MCWESFRVRASGVFAMIAAVMSTSAEDVLLTFLVCLLSSLGHCNSTVCARHYLVSRRSTLDFCRVGQECKRSG